MSDPAAVSVEDAAGWWNLLWGTVAFLLPGLAAADRWMPGRDRWVWAPVFSITLLVLLAVALDFAAGVPIRRSATLALALGSAAWIGRARLRNGVRLLLAKAGNHRLWGGRQAPRTRRGRILPNLPSPTSTSPNVPSPDPAGSTASKRPGEPVVAAPKPSAWGYVALLAALGFVAFTQYLPHVPGGPEPAFPYAALGYRAWDALHGRDDPYPMHVDEHDHLGMMAQVDRQAQARVSDPLSQADPPGSLFSVSGLRKERGFDVGILQVSHLTGLSLPTLARFLPAAWSAVLALAMWTTLRGARGAVASAAMLAVLHTSDRFLGTGFLVPSAFALPWILAVLHATLKGSGPARLAALWLLVTGAYFLHIVLGTLALAVGLLAALMQAETVRARIALAVAAVLPLVWIVPLAHEDIAAAVASEHTLPFDTRIFGVPGGLLTGLAAAGAFAAWYRWDRLRPETAPHRVLSVLAFAVTMSLAVSIQQDHRNDATYSRLVPTLFVCVAALAGLGLGVLGHVGARVVARGRAQAAAAAGLAFLLGAVALMVPMKAHLDEPYYRLLDDREWEAGAALASVAQRDSNITYLADPWNAPMYTAFSGATPWSYAKPGATPLRADDHLHYMRTRGPDPEWFAQRGITHVVGMDPPLAPHRYLGPGVYEVLPPAGRGVP